MSGLGLLIAVNLGDLVKNAEFGYTRTKDTYRPLWVRMEGEA